MRVVRFRKGETERWGILEDASLAVLSAAPYLGGERTGERYSTEEVEWLPPCLPSKIVCVGRNYAAHARELGNEVPTEPLLFLKPPSALLATEGTVLLPQESNRVDFEGEIGLIIGKEMTDIHEEEAWGYVFGVTCCNDVTARDLQRADKTFTRGKGFDTFAPCGPWVETKVDVDALSVDTKVNGELRQRAGIGTMVFSPAELLAYISKIMTLVPGDLIMTGTPAGVGNMKSGDLVEVRVHGVGELRHTVAKKH